MYNCHETVTSKYDFTLAKIRMSLSLKFSDYLPR